MALETPFTNIYLVLGFSVVLLAIGIYALTAKRNLIKYLIAIELLLDAVHLNFVAFSNIAGGYIDVLPHVVVVISICVGGCIAGVALALIIQAYRLHGTLDSSKLSEMKH